MAKKVTNKKRPYTKKSMDAYEITIETGVDIPRIHVRGKYDDMFPFDHIATTVNDIKDGQEPTFFVPEGYKGLDVHAVIPYLCTKANLRHKDKGVRFINRKFDGTVNNKKVHGRRVWRMS